jgi:hypothetical protein
VATSAKKTSATKSGKAGSISTAKASASKKAAGLRAASSARGKAVSAKGAKINVKTATKKTAPKAAAKPAAKPAPKGVPSKAVPAKAAPAKAAPSKAKAPENGKKAAAKPVAAPAKAPAAVEAAPTPAQGPTAGPTKPGKASPPPRLTVRTPVGADELKQKIGALATATGQIRNLKRGLQKSFFEIGSILKDIDDRRLYEVKGYGSFEAFLEREIDLGKQLGLRLSRAVQVFQREAALQAGLERVSAAIAVFDGEVDPNAAPPATSPTSSGGFRSPIPFHKQ